ncbi:DNA transformation protein [Povalibacter uvarum]|uniref:DNA transformation protein n=1 Tax=Povalibacter uvarum TaxID=732238 RepID=A0A841HUT4_9GAMM|nr:TfoX/Sxy family protein [Povalibacter uvarum]MBB6096583.1 DNA transformation protein [Povalibacter uvarum]
MSVSSDFLQYVIEQLTPIARISSRRMFGGVGLYADEFFFALIDDDTVYFKVDDSNRDDYVARGCKAFRPFADDPTYSMSYFELPADVLEDVDLLRPWARKSFAVAASAAAAKQRRAAKKPATRAKRAKAVAGRKKR